MLPATLGLESSPMTLQTTPKPLDLSEKGRTENGEPDTLDRRLFMQFLAYGNCRDTRPLVRALMEDGIRGVLYHDVNDPNGVGLLTFSEDPAHFTETVHAFLRRPPFEELVPKPEYTMFGRTYAIGYEKNLEDVLIDRPQRRVCDAERPWAVWYPLRRSGAFEQLPAERQHAILMEHGGVGRAFSEAGYVRDIRLACHGLDKNDNDFITALIGKDLFPLSATIQRMRSTIQTSQYLVHLGPFFVGKVARQASLDT